MKRLSEAIKRRIVEHLACFRTHAEASELIREEFDVSLTSRHVRAYDPMCFQFAGGRKWEEYHGLVRKRFETEIGDIPIAHRAFRLRKLQRMLDLQIKGGDMAGAWRPLSRLLRRWATSTPRERWGR
jgi:hypothetical protein